MQLESVLNKTNQRNDEIDANFFDKDPPLQGIPNWQLSREQPTYPVSQKQE